MKQNIWTTSYFAFLICITACSSGRSPSAPLTGPSLLNEFKKVSMCTERIWPGYSWNGFTILVVTPGEGPQAALRLNDQSVIPVDLKNFSKKEATESLYALFDIDGKPWMSVRLNSTEDALSEDSTFTLGAHEAFHDQEQVKHRWKMGGHGRGTSVPIRWEPRLYRSMLDRHLREAFLAPAGQEESLKKARYWFERWKNEFPDETLSTTDGYEGTARYAEILSKALLNGSCNSSEGELRSLVTEIMSKSAPLTSDSGRFELDSEGYFIGSTAAFLLRFDRKIPNWEARVMNGETPVEILLKDIASKADDASTAEQAAFEKAAFEMQSEVSSSLKSATDPLQSSSFTIVSIPRTWAGGAVRFRGFYLQKETGYQFAVLGQSFNFTRAGQHLNTDVGAVLVTLQNDDPCGTSGMSFVVRSSEVQKEGPIFKVDGEKIRGTLKAEEKVSDGVHWLCAQD